MRAEQFERDPVRTVAARYAIARPLYILTFDAYYKQLASELAKYNYSVVGALFTYMQLCSVFDLGCTVRSFTKTFTLTLKLMWTQNTSFSAYSCLRRTRAKPVWLGHPCMKCNFV
jgi:hypothetical protein